MATNTEINTALIEDVLAIYAQAEIEMLEKVAKRTARGIHTKGWNEQKLEETKKLNKELKSILKDADKLAKTNVSKGILDAYKDGVDSVNSEKGLHKTVLDDVDIPANVKQLVLATNKLLDNATFQVLRNADDAYTGIMANSATGILAGTDTRVQATQKMLNEFADKGITSFTDKAGRNWNLSSYAEMCMRTVSAHASLQGHVDRQLEVGEDLMKVSSIGTTCPLCSPWQGVVLSITGNTPGYHKIDEAKSAGLFHPNCKHTLTLHIPDLDGVGKTEPSTSTNKAQDERYNLIQQQRGNERNIRHWKRRQALAITPEERMMCGDKIKYWQHKQLLHCTKNNLRRQYAREGNMQGYAESKTGPIIGGRLKEYESAFKDVIGDNPKSVFNTFNLQLFAHKKVQYEKWLKDEIKSLDGYDVDVAQLKDKNNKSVTLTTMYKKYIGDNPGQDYAEITEFEKGTKEYKTGYAKWLKEQVEDIGVGYKPKPAFKEIIEHIDNDDVKLSATEMYKKYHDGKKPTEAYKELGGEEKLGIKYGKWVEQQKKDMLNNGITKTVPFDNVVTNKPKEVISKANETIKEAKKVAQEASKPPISLKDDFDKTKQTLGSEAKAKPKSVSETYFEKFEKQYTSPAQVTSKLKALDLKIKNAKDYDALTQAKEEKEFLKMYDLKLLEEVIRKSDVSKALYEVNWLTENVLKSSTIDWETKLHVSDKVDMWKEMEGYAEAVEEAKHKAKLAKALKEKAKKEQDDFDAYYESGDADKAYNDKVFDDKNKFELSNQIDQMIHRNHISVNGDKFESEGIKNHTKLEFKEWSSKITPEEKEAVRNYTGSAYTDINEALRGQDKKPRSYTLDTIEKLKSALDKASINEDVGLRRGVNTSGASYLLGGDGTADWIRDNLSKLNQGDRVVVDQGVMSTTPFTRGGFSGSCNICILARKGTKGVYVDSMSKHKGEQETVLAPGTNFRVVQVLNDEEHKNKFTIYLETLPELYK